MSELERPIQSESAKTLETLPLENRYYRWSVEGSPVVFFKQDVLKKAWDHCHDDQFVPPAGVRAGGVLMKKIN